MFKSLKAHFALAALAAIIAVPMTVQPVEAQAGERMRVMIPNLTPTDDTRDRFGERVADRTRDRLDLDRHVALSEREIDQAAREFDMRYRDLDCIGARQLAAQIGVGLVLCGQYHRDGEQLQVEMTAWTVPGQDELPMAAFNIPENQETEAAQRVVQDFQVLAEQIALLGWCTEAARSQNWSDAEDLCGRAVDAVPDSRAPRFHLGRAHLELGNYDQSLEHFQVLLEEDPRDEDVLENAGYSAAQLGLNDLARDYYTRYLEINPDNINVRVSIAHDLSTAGDPRGALDLLQEGLDNNPDHVGLLEQYGGSAFRAAMNLQRERPAAQDADAAQDPEVAALFREAIDALMRVVELDGEDADPAYVVNSVRAYLQLGEYEDALATAEQGIQVFTGHAGLWSELATAANRVGDNARAVEALERALEINPELPNARARMGNYYLAAGQVDEALSALHAAAEAGERTPDQLVSAIVSRAWNDHLNPEQDIPEGIRLMAAAKEFDVTPEMREQMNFFHGYGLIRHGANVEAPGTVESARQALPLFREALENFQNARDYGERTSGVDIANFIENAEQFIERQERIIERDGSRR
jgi:tetratricopeptide (TPR) repeat protein